MGHKVHPIGFRLGVIRDWQAKWYADAHYAEFLQEDVKLREAVRTKYREAAISLMEIDRQGKDITVTLHTARPGIVIGRGGQRVDEMRLYLENLVGKRVRLNILEIRQPEIDAYLVARAIAEQIERRVAYRRAMKQAIFRTVQAGAKGVRVSCSGRLGDAEIARRQTMHEGQVPLHTLRADIDYGFTEAHTTFGRIGIKVWIYKGEILPEYGKPEVEAVAGVSAEAAPAAEPKEEPVEAVAEVSAEAAPAAEPKEEPVEAVAEVSAEAAPAEKPEKKTAKPRAKKSTEVKASAESEEKPTKPAPRKRKKATAEIATEAEPAADKEKEEKDAAT